MKKSAAWLSKECRFAQSEYPKDSNESKDPKRTYVQWSTSDDIHMFPASEVRPGLEPGYYQVIQSMQGIFFKKLPVDLDNMVKFPETASDKVVNEIEKFWTMEPAFKERKMPHKRGILLYGPPGSGKSGTIKLVMKNIIDKKGIVIKFEGVDGFAEGMRIFREIEPETPVVVVMEDIDTYANGWQGGELTNILDGVTPISKVVFLATTNYPERLDSRILNRPSRFDKRFQIGMPNKESRAIYLKHVLGDKISPKELAKWVQDTNGLSIAHLKELVIAVTILGDPYEEALETLRSMGDRVDPQDPWIKGENR